MSITISREFAQSAIGFIGAALDQAYGGGGLRMITALQNSIHEADAAAQEAAEALLRPAPIDPPATADQPTET